MTEVHDVHVWTITSGFPALTAHVLVAPEVDCHDARRRIEAVLHDDFELAHTTLQVDHVTGGRTFVPIAEVVRAPEDDVPQP